MEDYKGIRQMHMAGVSQREIARLLHISRNTVRKYSRGDAVPWDRKVPERKCTVLTDEIIGFIQACLREDEAEGQKKQQHTAKRIYDRLVTEKGYQGAESTIRQKVRELRAVQTKAYVPLVFLPGEAMQADWGKAIIYLDENRQKINLFCARLCSSNMPIVFAYRRENEESFLDGLVQTFGFYGGTPEKVIFDNAKVAVKEGFGVCAKKQAGYSALSAHYGFDALFCNPGEGHEKGLVEGLVGWARRNILVPVPRVHDLDELNALLLRRCIDYRRHHIAGKPATVGDMFDKEKAALRPLPGYKFETAKCASVRVNAYSTVRFNTNDYSVPVSYCGSEVSVKGYPERVDIYSKGNLIASHQRSFGRRESVYRLEHYLPLLQRKGRAIFNAAPVRSNLPAGFLDWLKGHTTDHKELVRLLRDCVEYGWESVLRGETLAVCVPAISDIVTVLPVDLGQYDRLVGQKAGVQ